MLPSRLCKVAKCPFSRLLAGHSFTLRRVISHESNPSGFAVEVRILEFGVGELLFSMFIHLSDC